MVVRPVKVRLAEDGHLVMALLALVVGADSGFFADQRPEDLVVLDGELGLERRVDLELGAQSIVGTC